MGLFCKHEWTVLSDKMIDSGYEQVVKSAAKAGQKLERTKGISPDMFIKVHHIVVCCVRCGKLKEFSKQNFVPGW